MKILVVGGGGREHALVWKLKQSPLAEKIYCAPGNAGLAETAECVDISASDIVGLVEFAKKEAIDFTVVGMDEPLVMGIVDAFECEGLEIFGPDKAAARIEGSKSFSKELMKKYGIPTAEYEKFSDYDEAFNYIKTCNMPVVIKADGLALGKGVLICNNIDEAENALREMFINKKFGSSGDTVVIEEFLTGPEVSVLAFCDGKTISPMVSAQDHKRAFDGDKGPNTGGMGAFAPSREYTEQFSEYCVKNIFEKTVFALRSEDIIYKGIIFFGLMLTPQGPKVIEYNARFGDPETQAVLPLLKNDLLEIMIACVKGNLENINIEWSDGGCACVIIASGGYPETYKKGFEITGIADAEKLGGIKVFHAGTSLENSIFITNGGRVLGVSAKEDCLDAAIQKAYEGVNKIHFNNMHYRKDIGIK